MGDIDAGIYNLKIDLLTAEICFPIMLHKFQIDAVKVLYLVFGWTKCPIFILPQIAWLCRNSTWVFFSNFTWVFFGSLSRLVIVA